MRERKMCFVANACRTSLFRDGQRIRVTSMRLLPVRLARFAPRRAPADLSSWCDSLQVRRSGECSVAVSSCTRDVKSAYARSSADRPRDDTNADTWVQASEIEAGRTDVT